MATIARRGFLLVGLLGVLLACKGIGRDKGEKMGVPHDVSDGSWTVVSAVDLGKSIPANGSETTPPKTTTGKFVKVTYRVKPSKEAFVFIHPPIIVDSDKREYKAIDEFPYKPTDQMFDVPVGQTGEITPIYEIPAGAEGLQAKLAGNDNQDGIPVMVDLGM